APCPSVLVIFTNTLAAVVAVGAAVGEGAAVGAAGLDTGCRVVEAATTVSAGASVGASSLPRRKLQPARTTLAMTMRASPCRIVAPSHRRAGAGHAGTV